SRRRHTSVSRDWSSDVCSSDLLSSRKSRQAIRRAKQRNRNAMVVAVGCYPQTAKEEVESMSEVDIIVGTAERRRLPEYVEEFLRSEERRVEKGGRSGWAQTR